MSTIPLAKGYNEAKIEYPGYLSVKLDGTPIRCDVSFQDGDMYVSRRTRQGKENFSAEGQFNTMLGALVAAGVMTSGNHTFVAEVTHKDFPHFKDSGGIVRRQEPQEGLVLNVFDFQPQGSNATFEERLAVLTYMMQHVHSECFRVVPQFRVEGPEQFKAVQDMLLNRYSNCEGLVYRAASAEFKPGSRHWDYQKILVKPTADLRIHSYEEAVCGKTGAGKGMVGRINCWYKDTVIGVGPGKMKHAERKSEWEEWKSNKHAGLGYERILQVEYKKDPSYEALREPTFQCWRPDKEEPSYD